MPEPKWWVHPQDRFAKETDYEFTHNKKDALKAVDKLLKKYNGVIIERNPFFTTR